MEFKDFIKTKQRICKSAADCETCVLHTKNDDGEIHFCSYLIDNQPEIAEQIVEKWGNEHPVKTILSDFLEKYPNSIMPYGYPSICASLLGYKCKTDCSASPCTDCWDTPIEEVEE